MSSKSGIKDIVFFILRLAIAVGIIAWLVSGKTSKLVEAFESFDLVWLVPAFALYACHLCAGAWRWKMLLDVQEVDLSYFDALSLTMQGFFFSLVIPGALGGDFVKGAFVAKRAGEGRKLVGVFTILIDRVVGFIALFSLAGAAGLLSLDFLASLSGFTALVARALEVGCAVGFLAAAFLVFHRQLERVWGVSKLIGLADRLLKGAPSRLMEAMDSFRSSWPVLLKALAVSVVFIHLQLSAVVYCVARGLGVSEVPPKIYVLATTLGNAAGSLPLTPSGTGTRDTVIESLLSAVGVDKGAALATPLIMTGIILIFNLLGGVFFLVSSGRRKRLEAEAEAGEVNGDVSP